MPPAATSSSSPTFARWQGPAHSRRPATSSIGWRSTGRHADRPSSVLVVRRGRQPFAVERPTSARLVVPVSGLLRLGTSEAQPVGIRFVLTFVARLFLPRALQVDDLGHVMILDFLYAAL